MKHKIFTKVRAFSEFMDVESLKIMKTGWGNGYVCLPPEHPWYGMNYDDIPAHAHGGLTYSGEEELEHPDGYPGHTDTYWVIGFDTAHYMDGPHLDENYVRAETERLKQQAINAIK